MPGMGLTNYPNQYEVNKSDKEKVNDKNKSDKQQHILIKKLHIYKLYSAL